MVGRRHPGPRRRRLERRASRRDDARDREPRDLLLPPPLRRCCSRSRDRRCAPGRRSSRGSSSPGESQGGALALAAAALLSRRSSASATPTCRSCATSSAAIEMAIDPPYTELVTYLRIHPELERACRRTLRHFDNAVLATRITARTAIGVGAARHDHAPVDRLRRLQRDRGVEGDRRLPVLRSLGADEPRRAAAARFRHRAQGKSREARGAYPGYQTTRPGCVQQDPRCSNGAVAESRNFPPGS